jgi:hypothetical protein
MTCNRCRCQEGSSVCIRHVTACAQAVVQVLLQVMYRFSSNTSANAMRRDPLYLTRCVWYQHSLFMQRSVLFGMA